jgi:1-acyl-sn-glycerol-3-phosphate acyltransferase
MSPSPAPERTEVHVDRDYRPPAHAPWLARASRRVLAACGWRVVLATPVPSQCVIVIAPHTSNWDFFVGLLAKWTLDLPVRWIGKHTIFRWPVRGFLLRIGGIPVDRRRRHGLIERLAGEFETSLVLRLVIAPEGTRSRTGYWKSGFYHLALATRVPLGLAYLDYRRREVGVGGYLALSGDVARDMETIAAFYAGCTARRPEQQGPVQLRDEDPSPRSAPSH